MAFLGAAAEEALAGLVDAADFSDVAADVGRLNIREFADSLRMGRYPSTLEAVQGATAVGGVVAAEPVIKAAGRAIYRHFRKRGWHRTSKSASKIAAVVTPDRPNYGIPHRRINSGLPIMPRSNFSTLRFRRAKRKRAAGKARTAKRRKHANAVVKATRIIRGTFTNKSGYRVVKKLSLAKTPTGEGGHALTSLLMSSVSKTGGGSSYAFSYDWSLDDFPSYTDFTNLYQYYRILWVKLHFVPLQNAYLAANRGSATYPVNTTANSGTTSYITGSAPWIIFAKDEAGAAVFGSANDAMEHNGAAIHVFNGGDELSIYLEPKNHEQVGASGSTVETPVYKSSWIPTASTAVKHYGLRCYMENQNMHSQIKVFMEMKVAFKDPKT